MVSDDGFGGSWFRGRRRGRWTRSRRDYLAVLRDNGAAHDLVGEIDSKLLVLGCHGEKELGDVVGVERRGLSREPRWQISVALYFGELQTKDLGSNVTHQ